jgi:hypothetical protein
VVVREGLGSKRPSIIPAARDSGGIVMGNPSSHEALRFAPAGYAADVFNELGSLSGMLPVSWLPKPLIGMNLASERKGPLSETYWSRGKMFVHGDFVMIDATVCGISSAVG